MLPLFASLPPKMPRLWPSLEAGTMEKHCRKIGLENDVFMSVILRCGSPNQISACEVSVDPTFVAAAPPMMHCISQGSRQHQF